MTERDDLHIAYQSERGVQARCPTTGESYITNRVQFTRVNNQRAVWCSCRHCDTERRVRSDPQFNPSQPQRHLYILSEVSYEPITERTTFT